MKRFFSIFLAVLLCVTLTTTLVLAQDADIYVDANEGNDKTGDGTQDGPYKTITKAVQVANNSMDRKKIHVAKGVYNLNTGEKFPLTVKNVDLVGNPDDLEAVKIATQMTFRNSLIKGLHFYRSVEVQDGTVIQENAFSGINGDAINLRIEGSSKIRGNSFKDNQQAIDGNVSGSLTITKNTLLNNSRGASIALYKGGEVAIASNQVRAAERGRGFIISLRGGKCRAIVQGNEITARVGVGLSFRGGGGRALIPNNTISSDETGIELRLNDSGGEVVLANNKISGQNSVSLTGSGNVKADLGGGPLENSGKNTFQASEYCIKYELPPYNGKIYAKNNTWKDAYGNTFQPPTTLEGSADTDHFLIEDEGNMIVFSD
ncbi:DUF1565 domain-containing protein [Candidatus Bipolaricaulota bacterium]|nr:DUF1565 domain-containing protein [Candidatus Bipolaricaulota bacterium]